MEKEFDFLSNKALCVFNDTEPVVVKYNGETVKNLSAEIEKQETTENSITYQSEYKQNLLNMSVEGNTEQKQYEGYNLAYCSTDNKFAYQTELEILSKNSFTVTTKNTIITEYVIFNIPVKPNTKVKISYNFTRNYNNSARVLYWATSGLKASSGTLIGLNTISSKTEGSVSQTITTGNTEFLGISFYIKETADIIQDAQILITDLMVTYDTEKTEFEPYVGGIPSPNVEYPQPIENSTNVSVELRGINLWSSKRIYSQDMTYEVIDNNTVKINANGSSIVPIYCFRIAIGGKGGKYRFSLDFKVKNSPNISSANVFNIYYSNSTAISSGTLVSSNKMTFDTDTFMHNRFSVTIPNGYQYLNINFNASHSYATFENYEVILKNLQCTLTEGYIDFEPYFEPTKVDIPNEVTLADGTVVPLRFAKLGNYADKLVVVKISSRVAYIQSIEKINANNMSVLHVGKSLYKTHDYCYIEISKKPTISLRGENPENPLCNNCVYLTTSNNEPTESTITTFRTQTGNGNRFLYFFPASWGLDNGVKMRDWFNANETIIQYVLATPIEYDLTNTDLGQDLLNLAKSTQNQTNTITVNSTLPISKLDVGYAIWGGRDESLS